MAYLANLFNPSPSYSIISLAVAIAAGFAVGLIFKSGLVSKHKRRVLYLEDEMLLNHSRILDLEKELHKTKVEKSKLNGSSVLPKVELKAS